MKQMIAGFVFGAVITLIAVVALLADLAAARSRGRREIREQIEEIKKDPETALPELMNILKGDGSDMSKMIAVSILAELNQDLKDPEVEKYLNDKMLPMMKGILEGDADRSLKRQVLSALGNIKTDASAELAAAILSIANRNPESTAVTIAQSQAMPVLHNQVLYGEKTDVQQRAVREIGRVGSSSDISFLKETAAANEKLQPVIEQAIRDIQRRADGNSGSGFQGRRGGFYR